MRLITTQNFENDVKMNFAKEEFRWMNPDITIFVHDAVFAKMHPYRIQIFWRQWDYVMCFRIFVRLKNWSQKWVLFMSIFWIAKKLIRPKLLQIKIHRGNSVHGTLSKTLGFALLTKNGSNLTNPESHMIYDLHNWFIIIRAKW